MSLRVFDKYEVIRRLATGGMGDIFLARQVGVAGFSRLVVLKSLRADIVERDDFFAQFLNEARTAATLNHPHVVAIYEVDEYRGVYFIAMEYIDGTDIAALLTATVATGQRLPFRIAAGIVHDAARGLHHAHVARDDNGRSLGIVHRDVSPQNIMVRMDGIAKVVDFGIAAGADRVDPFRGRLQGKLRYMAPEQLTGETPTPASDQFALGAVLWEMLAHERLFVGTDASAVLREISTRAIQPPSSRAPHVPPALDAIVLRMLSRAPADRFADTQQVASALRAFIESAGGQIEQQISRFMQVMVGASVRARTQSLTPEPVIISGLLEAAEIRCGACGSASSLRHRYCPECGAPLSASVPESTPDPGRPRAPVTPAPVSSLRSLLHQHAHALDELLTGEVHQAVVLAARIQRDASPARDVDSRLSRTISALIEPFEPTVVQLSPSALTLVFDRGVADALRALRLAVELDAALRRIGDGSLATTVVLVHGSVSVSGAGSAGVTVRGPALEEARARLTRQPSPGIYVDRTLRDRLRGRAELGDDGRVVAFHGQLGRERGPLVGRRDELMSGKDLLHQAAAGRSGVLVYAGPSGVGKSRVGEELASLAAKQGFVTVLTRAAAGRGWIGSELLAEVLREALRSLLVGDPAAPAVERLAHLALEPSVAAQVAARLDGRATDDAGDDALISALVRLSEAQSFCWVVDDVHLWPAAVVEVFDRLRERLRSGPGRVALVLTRDTPLTDVRSVVLEPLSDEKLLAVVEGHVGGGRLPPAAAQVVLVRAGGYPGTAVLVVEALIALGGLQRAGSAWRVGPQLMELELPHHHDELLRAHLASLSRVAQVFVRTAAIIESPFSAELVFDVLRYGGDRSEVVEEVVASRLVRRSDSGLLEIARASAEGRLRRGVLPADRRKIHERVANLLRADPTPTPAVLAAIAHHALEAGDDEAGAPEARRAAEAQPTHSAQRAMWLRCIEAYRRSMVVDRDQHLPGLLHAIARATPVIAAHRLADALTLLDTAGAITVADRGRSPSLDQAYAEALSARGLAYLHAGRMAEAERDVEAALEWLPREAQDERRAPLVEAAARVLEERGDLSGAAERMTEVAELYRSVDDPAQLWRPLNALGRLYLRLGQHERARALIAAAEHAATSAGSAPGRVATAINRAALEPPIEGLRILDEAARIALEAGDALSGARIAYNRGALSLAVGQIVEGQAALERALAVSTEIGWRDGVALAHRALVAAQLR